MAGGPAAVLNILITGNNRQALATMAQTDAALKRSAATAQKSTAATAASIGRGMARAATAVGLVGAASIAAAAQWENAFADVRKTVDMSEAGFKRLEMGLRDMAKEIPVSAGELANLAAEAGALGVRNKDLLRFTRTAADLGVATDMSASDAANALARLGNVMRQRTAKDFARMGATLVDLGNKGASTEEEISTMALRIAGAGKVVGLTSKQVLGLAASMANVGIRAEMGGSAISQVMLQMQDSIAQGGDVLNNFAEVAGVSTKEFAKVFSEDATQAVGMFAEGLSEVNRKGGSTMQTLAGVELGERRTRETLLKLGEASEGVSVAQEIANKAWGEGSALTEEANKKYKTTANQFEILKNRIYDVGISLGEDLLPAVNKVMRKLGEGNLGGAIAAIAGLGAQMGVKLAGALVKAFWEADILGKMLIASTIIRIVGGKGALLQVGTYLGKQMLAGFAATKFGQAIIGMLPTTGQMSAAGRVRGAAFGAGLVIGILTFGVILAQEAESIYDRTFGKDSFFGSRSRINFANIDAQVGKGMAWVGSTFSDGVKDMRQRWFRGVENIDWGGLWGTLKGVASSAMSNLLGIIGGALGKLGSKFGGLKNTAVNAFNAIKGPIVEIARAVSGALMGIVRAVVSVIRKFENLKEKLPDITPGGGDDTWGIIGGALGNATGVHIQGNKRGGVIVPGSGSGDKVRALLEPGEVVLNKRAVAAMGGARKANTINQAIPRFAGGGFISEGVAQTGRAGVGMAAAAGASLIKALKKASKAMGGGPASWRTFDALAKKFHLSITSGFRPGDSDSFHGISVGGGRARATDYAGSARGMMGFATLLRNKYVKKLAELFYDPLGGWDNGTSIGAIGNHSDHVHVAFQKGGIVGDFARAGADTKASKKAMYALFMAGMAESGMRDLGYGDSTSEGVLQLLSSTASNMGLDPHDEYAVAKAFLTRGYWGKGGAIGLARAGNGAATIAHLVQGNATGSGVYRAQADAAQRLLAESGLRFPDDRATLGNSAKDVRKRQRRQQRIAQVGLDIDKLPISKTAKDTLRKAVGNQTKLLGRADAAAEWASRASSLEGLVGGHDELYWLQQELKAIWELRNRLVAIHNILTNAAEKINEAIAKTPKGKARSKLKELRDATTGKIGEIADTLSEVQGSVLPGTNPFKVMKDLPSDLGIFGGRIFDVRSSIRSLGGADTATDSESESAALLKQMNLQLRQQVAVSQAQYKTLQSTPYVGAFQSGGVVPGTGPKLATVHGGETITPKGGATTVILIEDGAVDARRIRTLSGAEAQRAIRRSARRGNRRLPSAGGGGV